MSVNKDPHPPALRAFSLSRTRQRAGVRTLSLKNVAKGAGAVVLGLIALDLVATAVTLAFGWEYLKR
jgi:hypothetical protein